jgi:hypothetical protein
MQDSAVRETFEIVERMFKKTHATSVRIDHHVFAGETRRIGQLGAKTNST